MDAPRNLLLFSDGTGNRGGKTRGTNVWRLYNALDRHSPDVEQLALYDDGVGTRDSTLSAVLGGAFGWGLSRNLRQLYEFLVVNHREGDGVLLFGFSRGAFTVRCLAGMIARCGLLRREVYESLDGERRARRLREIVWAYRAASEERHRAWRGPAEDFKEIRIDFVGVWDTVDAVGMPIDELRGGIDRLWTLVFRRRAWGFKNQQLSGVRHARQALALDDDRRTFHPNVWHLDPREEHAASEDALETLEQVWFAGAHSNVGGGYPKDGLAHVTLDWMMGELESLARRGGAPRVVLLAEARARVQEAANAFDRLYDPRTGPAALYRYSPRRPEWFHQGLDDFYQRSRGARAAALPSRGIPIHVSVWQRIRRGSQAYAPLFLPGSAIVVHSKQGGPFAGSGTEGEATPSAPLLAAARAVAAGTAPLVRRRQWAYGISLGVGIVALVAALVDGRGHDPSEHPLARLVTGLVPDLLSGLIDSAAAHPGPAALVLLVLTWVGIRSLRLRARIHDAARLAYEAALREECSSP